MIGGNNRASRRNLFRKLEILPLASQYILSLMLFVVNIENLFILNSGNYDISTRKSNNCYQLISDFNVYQKGVHCMGIRLYNKLPPRFKEESHNPGNLKPVKTFSSYTLLLFYRRVFSI
jgi:hypothetical protein